ncbi:MAG: gamma-glutamyltransferase [Gammaproteobacteria bacterium]|nr:gamma-glutamyltransferase [Gammaproteobacteria bacterium]
MRAVHRNWCALVLVVVLPAAAADAPPRAALASAHPLATEAGIEILAAGGNAFDAAVAVSAALAVVEPYSSGLGGGGFWLLHRASDGRDVMIDGRETAPAEADRDMYLNATGEVDRDRAVNGPLAAGIPGEVAALEYLASRYGRLPLARNLAPAIRLARDGFVVTERYRMLAGYRADVLRRDPEAAAIFLLDGEPPPVGHVLKQADLAATLAIVAQDGARGFYSGNVAERLVAGVRAAGGRWSRRDLAAYRVIEREPVIGEYRGVRVVTAALPSSGGVVLLEALNILAPWDLPSMSATDRHHVVIEAMRRAYRDRADYLGDPDFVDVPVTHLLDPQYAAKMRASIDPARATPSSSLPPAGEPEPVGTHTTHFSVIDREGNRVAATLSINLPFGAAFVPPGTGVVLNDEMDDFSAKPMTPNAYGLVGVNANAIAPGKRPLSSMTPTFVETPARIGILGTPGGSRIISMVLLGVLEFAAGEPPARWVSEPRYHHQYLPDEVQFERGGLDDAEQAALRARGHTLTEVGRTYGNMQAVLWDRVTGAVTAASDPRGEGVPGYD